MKANGVRVDTKSLLLAAICDRLSILIWQQTKDGVKGRNMPKMIYDTFVEPSEIEQKISFNSGDEFKEYWNNLK